MLLYEPQMTAVIESALLNGSLVWLNKLISIFLIMNQSLIFIAEWGVETKLTCKILSMFDPSGFDMTNFIFLFCGLEKYLL